MFMDEQKLPGIDEILQLLPHRHPFLLVDRVTAIVPQKSISGVKNISYNEWYFQGLPDGLRIVPASILSEAVAQLGAILIFTEEENRNKLVLFSGVHRVRFRKPVKPGDELVMTAEIQRRKGRLGRFSVLAMVGEKIVMNGTMQFALE
jgi:3-hydroxymyristoyl/3-hydroxydecanoyl-(acyl carrier protein) dehydratase